MRHSAKAQRILLIVGFLAVHADRGWPLATPNPVARHLIPLTSFQREFKITAGKDQGRRVALTSRPDLTNEKKSIIVFGDYAAVHLVRDQNGMLLLERLDLIKSHSYVVYEPSLPVLPVNLEAPGRFEQEAHYRMYNSETGRLKRSGRVTHSVQRISRSQFDTPAGPIDGFFVEMDHRMDMEYLSELRITLGLGCREGEGPVFGTGQYKVTRLGVFTETKKAAAGIIHR
jgi:hypothetical protein